MQGNPAQVRVYQLRRAIARGIIVGKLERCATRDVFEPGARRVGDEVLGLKREAPTTGVIDTYCRGGEGWKDVQRREGHPEVCGPEHKGWMPQTRFLRWRSSGGQNVCRKCISDGRSPTRGRRAAGIPPPLQVVVIIAQMLLVYYCVAAGVRLRHQQRCMAPCGELWFAST